MQVNLGFGVTQSTSRRSDSRPSNARSAERNCGINERQKEFVCLFDCLFVCLFVYLIVCLFVSLFVCLFFVCLIICSLVLSFGSLTLASISRPKRVNDESLFIALNLVKNLWCKSRRHSTRSFLSCGVGWRDEGMKGWWDDGMKERIVLVKMNCVS